MSDYRKFIVTYQDEGKRFYVCGETESRVISSEQDIEPWTFTELQMEDALRIKKKTEEQYKGTVATVEPYSR